MATPPWWDPAVDASVDPWSDSVHGRPGSRSAEGAPVRLRPSHRADAQDLFLAGLSATVAGVFTDVDGGQHVAVTVDDDPATAELAWQGRYLFFHPDEVEPLLRPRDADDARRRPGRRDRQHLPRRRRLRRRGRGTGWRRHALPDGVRVADFGIRGVHLAYELLDGYDALVLVDAVPMGEPPGTVAVIEPDGDALPWLGGDGATAASTPTA